MFAQGTFQGIDAEVIIHVHWDFPGQHITACLVHYCSQIKKTVIQPNVSDIWTPHLIRFCDRHLFQQIRINLMSLSLPAGVWLGGYWLQAHQTHQSLDSFEVYRKTSAAQIHLYISAAIKRMSQELFVYQPHKFQVFYIFNMAIPGPVVWRAWQLQQLILPANTKLFIITVNAFDFLGNTHPR